MRYVFDKEELKFRQKLQMFGNMKLLCELYLKSLIKDDIIIQCLVSLFDEVNDMNIEIICHIMTKLGQHVAVQVEKEINGEPISKKQ